MSEQFPNSNKKVWLKAIFVFSLLFFWIIYLFQNTFYGMVTIWARSETFTHGFLVLPIVLWLVWRKREEMSLINPKANFYFLLPIAALLFVWLLGDLVAVNSVTQLAATALVILLVFSVFGWPVCSVIFFPLLFLLFSVPIGEFLLPILMEWTAKFTVIAIRLSGVPVYQEGLQFVIPSGSWSVVEACSGVRYLISSLMIGALYSYLNYQSLNRRIIFICVSIVIPVLANWMRAYFIVMLGHFSDNKLAVGFDHLIYGWLFFGVVIILMFLIGSRWAEPEIINIPHDSTKSVNFGLNESSFWYVGIALLVLLALPVTWLKFSKDVKVSDPPVLVVPLTFNSGWKNLPDQFSYVKPNFSGNSVDFNATYFFENKKVGLYLKYYRNQNYDNKLVNSENSIFDPKDKSWQSLSTTKLVVNIVNSDLVVKSTDWRGLGLPGDDVDVRIKTWKMYWVNGSFTDNDHKAKLYGAMQRLMGKGDDAAVIVLYARESVNQTAGILLEEFLRDNHVEIEAILVKATGK